MMIEHDIRLGQLFAHLGFLGEDQTGRCLGNIEDEQLLARRQVNNLWQNR